ncbi:MAG TPA: zinc-binding dehydrogenase, partial [Candidatus Nitrosotenuis sp.]|nr:zinc-binding dehydrogenase [Candidatus Nitrosotenuis sp.]
MLAAVLVELNRPLELAELGLPRLECGQVLVRLSYSGICGSQLGEIAGVKGPDPYLPHLLGHEGSGVVLETGPGVSRVRPGDRVVLHWRKAEGIQSAPPRYTWGSRTVNAGWVTTFNEEAVVSENRLTPLPDDVDLEDAVLYGCALTTGFGVVERDAGVRLGESVLVYGAGGVGQAVVLGAALAGAHPIVAVDLYPHKLEVARRLGATHTFLAGDPDLRRALPPEGADVAVDTTGLVPVIEEAYRLTAPTGRTILVGVTPHDRPVTIDSMPLHFGKVITGSHGGGSVPSR